MPFDIRARQQSEHGRRRLIVQEHKKTPRPHEHRRFIVKSMLGLLVIVSVGAFGFFVYVVSLLNNQLVYRDPAGTGLSSVRLDVPLRGSLAANVASLLFNTNTTLAGEENDRVNFLLLGIPGEPNPAPNLTDAMIVASVQPSTGKVAMISVPRDMFAIAPGEAFARKMNGLYQLGLIRAPDNPTSLLVGTIEELSEQRIHYVVLVDLQILKDGVDALGGLTIEVTERIYDPSFPGPGYTYDPFELEPGVHTLDGDTVIKYVRTRHSVRGDFDRTERQRQVIRALTAKIRDVSIAQLPVYWGLIGDFRERVATNLSVSEIKRVYEIVKDTNSNRIKAASLNNYPGTGLLKSTHITVGSGAQAYALLPKDGFNKYDDIHAFFESIFETF